MWGLVNRVAEPQELDAAALDIAGQLAGNAPLAQTGNKRVISALLDEQGALSQALERELIELRRLSFESEDLREGMRASPRSDPPVGAGGSVGRKLDILFGAPALRRQEIAWAMTES